MSKINIRKRGNYYEYRVEIAPVDGKRQWLSKSGFRTKPEAGEAGVQAYNEYLNAGIPFKTCNLSYSDYLDYWLDNYCKNNLRYNTIQTYKLLINKYIKPFDTFLTAIIVYNLFYIDLIKNTHKFNQ